MSGNKILLDTNIVLYLLSGDRTIAEIINERQLYISFVTELELLGYHGLAEEEGQKVKAFISECKVVNINEQIKKTTIDIRKKYRTKLPDSIIAATSLYLDIPMITADAQFNRIDDITVVIYEVG